LNVISVTAQCEWDSEGRWNAVDTFVTDTGEPIGDPGLHSFDPHEDSFVDAFLEGVALWHLWW
jgi:hypothetical protein